MPRTRAAMRILEDDFDAASIPLPTTPREERPPLSEVTTNNREELIVLELNLTKPAKKPPAKALHSGKKEKKEKIGLQENNFDVIEDDCESTVSSAVEEACDALMKVSMNEFAMSDEADLVLTSEAVECVREQLSPLEGVPSENEGKTEDSFLDQIASRSPAKTTESKLQGSIEADDSFVEQIVARTPLRLVARIEDSVEAMDVLEDSIEKIAASLHASPSNPINLHNSIKPPRTLAEIEVEQGDTKSKAETTKAHLTRKVDTTSKAITKSTVTTLSKRTKATVPLATIKQTTKMKSAQTSITTQRVTTTSKVQPAQISPAIDPIKSTRASKPRPRVSVSSTTRPPYIPTKSTKPATISTFTLPSATITARLREQREVRLAAQDAAVIAKRNFKARPNGSRVSSGPLVRDTAASRARVSLMHGSGAATISASESRISSMRTEVGGPAKLVRTPASVRTQRTLAPAAKHATIAVAKRTPLTPSTASTATALGSQTRTRTMAARSKATRPALTSLTFTRITSSDNGATPDPAAAMASVTPVVSTTRGSKDFGGSVRGAMQTKDAERKTKEEAARKARVEAAERGRAASREWAERMKTRKAIGAAKDGIKVGAKDLVVVVV